jgi:hypothetical protein
VAHAAVLPELLAVVGRDHEQCAIRPRGLADLVHQAADLPVGVAHLPVVERLQGLSLGGRDEARLQHQEAIGHRALGVPE